MSKGEAAEQLEFVDWLTSHGIYNEFASSQTMISMSKVWKLLKARIAELEAEKAELEKQEPLLVRIRRNPPAGSDRYDAWKYIEHEFVDGLVFTCDMEVQRLYTKPLPPAVPDGWQLVPKEPTAEMLLAMAVIVGGSTALQKSVWSDALSAAPKEVE